MPTSAEIVAIARLFLYVREAPQNKGQRVEAIQRWCGGIPGDSWCAYWATMVLDIAFAGDAPILRQGNCHAIYLYAKKMHWVTETPATGDLFLFVSDLDHAHHIGIVTSVDGTVVTGIAGNTSADGKSANGDRVAERPVPAEVFIAYPRG